MTLFQVSLPSLARVGQILKVNIIIDSALWGDRQYSGYTYEWQRLVNGNWTNINAPSLPFYTAQNDDAGKGIRCVVTLTRDGSRAQTTGVNIIESTAIDYNNQYDNNSEIKVLNELKNVNLIEGIDSYIYFKDVFTIKGNSVTYRIVDVSGNGVPNSIYFDQVNGILRVVGREGFYGSFDFLVEANYGNRSYATDYFTLDISPSDKGYVPDQQIRIDQNWFYRLPDQFLRKASDLSLVLFSATLSDGSPLPAWLSYDDVKRVFVGTPPAFYDGTLTIRITATGSGSNPLKLQDFFNLKVGDGVDREAVGSISIEGRPGSFNAISSLSDPDGQIRDTIFIWETSDLPNGNWNEIKRFVDENNFNFSLNYGFDVKKYLRVVAITEDLNGYKSQFISNHVLSWGDEKNSPPALSVSSNYIMTDGSSNAAVIASATDVDNNNIVYFISSGPRDGTIQADGSRFTYMPYQDRGDNIFDSFVVMASDGHGGFTSQTIKVNDSPGNDPPYFVFKVQSLGTQEDRSLTIFCPSLDIDGDATTLKVVSGPSYGRLGNVNGWNVQYTPNKDYNGTDSFVVTASDGKGGTASQIIEITVAAVNDAPTFATASQAVSATAGTAKTITLAATDVDGDAVTYTVATPGKGTAAISGSTLTYTPGATATGSDSFVVTASDGKGGTAKQTINATVAAGTSATNVAPAFTTASQAVSTNEDTAKSITIAATDADNDALTYTISTAASRGTTSISGGTITYTPSANYNGTDSFVVAASDGKGGSATQTINMSVTPVNDAPVFAAASQAVSATAGTAKTITLAATDVDGDALTYTVATPSKGTAAISGSTLTYTPGATATGSDSFVVTASDGKGGTATKTIDATVGSVVGEYISGSSGDDDLTGTIGNDRIFGNNGNDRINGSAGDDGIWGGDSSGAQSGGELGNDILYGDNGSDRLGGEGGDDALYGGNGDDILEGGDGSDFLSGDDGDDRIWGHAGDDRLDGGNGNDELDGGSGNDLIDGGAGNDVARYRGALSDYVIVPNSDGSVMVTDSVFGRDGTDTLFNVEVIAFVGGGSYNPISANKPPTFSAASQAVSATAGTAKTITLAATDVDGDALTYTVATPGKGTASISGSTLTYTPGATATGSDSFVVTASDGKGGTATQTINATVAVAAAAKAFTVNTLPGWVGSVGGNGSISGSNGFEDITVLYGQIALDGSFNRGGDIVRVSGNADSYVIGRTSASSAYIEAGTTTKVTIPIGSTGLGIVYDDGVRKLSFSGGAYKIGNQTFSADPTKITSATDGTVLPTGANPSTQAVVSLLAAGLSGGTAPDLTITGKVRIVGTNGVDVIKVGSTGGDLTFDGSFNRGGDIIILNKAAGDYSAAKFSGSTIVISSGIEKLTIPMGSAGLTLRFTDGDRTLIFKNGAFNIGDQIISSPTATPLTPSSITLSADNASGSLTFNAGTGSIKFTDDAGVRSDVLLQNFSSDDRIFTNTAALNYNFAISEDDPDDLVISFNNNGVLNQFILDEVLAGKDVFIDNYTSAVTAVGWDFMAFG